MFCILKFHLQTYQKANMTCHCVNVLNDGPQIKRNLCIIDLMHLSDTIVVFIESVRERCVLFHGVWLHSLLCQWKVKSYLSIFELITFSLLIILLSILKDHYWHKKCALNRYLHMPSY